MLTGGMHIVVIVYEHLDYLIYIFLTQNCCLVSGGLRSIWHSWHNYIMAEEHIRL